jgi:hypothetical protein
MLKRRDSPVTQPRRKWVQESTDPPHDPKRVLAEQIVKILLNNPASANSGQYERIMEEIRLYTVAAQEGKC